MTTPQEPWTPTVASDETLDDVPLSRWIGEAVGAASMCWEDITKCGEFDSTRAAHVADGLHAHIQRVIQSVIDGTTKATQYLNDGTVNIVNVRYWDGYLETYEATEVRFGSDLLWMRLTDGLNRHIPLRHVRWFSTSRESHGTDTNEIAR